MTSFANGNFFEPAAIESLQQRLAVATVASCTCGTKTPDVAAHNEDCTFRLLLEADRAITELAGSAFGGVPAIQEGNEHPPVLCRTILPEEEHYAMREAVDTAIEAAKDRVKEFDGLLGRYVRVGHAVESLIPDLVLGGVPMRQGDIQALRTRAAGEVRKFEAVKAALQVRR